jgi:hypothetical protein
MPSTFAQRGEFCCAYGPTFCASSDSSPALSSSFDSGEPRWRSQTVSKTNSVNWRYSDCQFSITAFPNSDETT